MKDFFVSYNQNDREWAEWIAWQLEAQGYTTVIQAWDFRAGGNFVVNMQEAASKAQRTIAVLSPDYLESRFTAPEWAAAFARDPTGGQGILVPVRVRECEPKGLLPQIVYIDLVRFDEQNAKERLLQGVKSERAKPSAPPRYPGHVHEIPGSRPIFPGPPPSMETATQKTFCDRLKSGADGPLMVIIPAGRFRMGSPADEPERFDDEGPQHDVHAATFAMGVHAVTFEDYEPFCEDTLRKYEDYGWGRGRRPVINVSFEEARAYCAWLGKQTGRAYRLPSESEWEYACRAGTDTPFHFGPHITTDQANFNGTYAYKGSVEGEYRQRTVPVGSFPPNAFGLYDMHGNVWEWCQDQRHGSYRGAPSDGSAWEGEEKADGVLRGGSWDGGPRYCRAACRLFAPPGRRYYSIGFRVSCTAPAE